MFLLDRKNIVGVGIVLVLAVCTALLTAIVSHAQFEEEGTVRALNGFTSNNATGIFSLGEVVEIIGTVEEDLFVVSGVFNNVSHQLNHDVFLLGSSLQMGGVVGDDLRVLGDSLTIGSEVGGDVFAVVESFNLQDDGFIKGDVDVYGNTVYINGTIEGTLRVIAEFVEFGEDAILQGPILLDLPSEEEVSIVEGALLGEIKFTIEEDEKQSPAYVILALLGGLLFGLCVGLVCDRRVSVLKKISGGKDVLFAYLYAVIGSIAIVVISLILLFVKPLLVIGIFLLLVFISMIFLSIILLPIAIAEVSSTYILTKLPFWVHSAVAGALIVLLLKLIFLIPLLMLGVLGVMLRYSADLIKKEYL